MEHHHLPGFRERRELVEHLRVTLRNRGWRQYDQRNYGKDQAPPFASWRAGFVSVARRLPGIYHVDKCLDTDVCRPVILDSSLGPTPVL